MKKCLVYETLGSVTEMRMETQNGLMTLSGTFGVCGVINNNKRIYEKNNYAKCVKDIQARIKENGGIPGELEHPNSMNITLENVSHKITAIDIDESGVVTGTIQLLDTPKGRIARAIVEGGLPLFVSSRANGSVDKSGNVTLETLSTYDLVGTPGFSQAKMHLNESQSCINLNENLCLISETEAEAEATSEDMNTEIIENLSLEIDYLKKQIDILKESQQEYLLEEYTPLVQEWLEKHFSNKLIQEHKAYVNEEFAGMVQNWLTEHYTPHVAERTQQWLMEHYTPHIANRTQEWIVNEFGNKITEWISEEVLPEHKAQITESIKQWVSNDYSNQLEQWLNEHYEGAKGATTNDILSMLESIPVNKPTFGRELLTESNEPEYIRLMPATMKPSWAMADPMVKESVMRRARLYDLSTPTKIQNFWESIDLAEVSPSQTVYEGLQNVEDLRERQIRAAFRKKRM